MRVVIALGGNALLKRGEPLDVPTQRRNAQRAAASIATVVAGNELIVTHGNGPQVGLLALQSAAGGDAPYPLDVLGAQTEGMIGYMLEQELMNAVGARRIATLLTQTRVDPADRAFDHPTKFIGPVYAADEAKRLAAERGWRIAPDGERWRRVVPSPEPTDIVEVGAIELLLVAGYLVICAGGGGIPVGLSAAGKYEGIECVIDKDLTSELLAERLRADCLVMLTDVPAVFLDWGKPQARELRTATPAELAQYQFASGSMGPKIEAARRFATSGPGRRACIGSLDDVAGILAGTAGTTVSSRQA